MDYFKKVGRPTDEEQAVVNALEALIKEKQIPRSEIPICQSLDDLLEVQNLLEAYEPKVEPKDDPEKEETTEETKEDFLTANVEEDKEEPDYFASTDSEKVVDQPSEVDETEIVEESTEEELVVNELDTSEDEESTDQESEEEEVVEDQPSFIADDYDPFSDEIEERSYNMDSKKESDSKAESETDSDLELEESGDTPLEDLPPNSKRKIAERTANQLLKGYAKIAPQPFKWLAKVNEEKIENLAFEGEIDINLEVSEGTTFDEWVKQTNEQVDEIFEVDEETLDEIREPLIDVLLEQKMELTPQQRLAMAVVSHLFQMLTVAISLRRQNNRILEYQKRMTLMAAQPKAA